LFEGFLGRFLGHCRWQGQTDLGTAHPVWGKEPATQQHHSIVEPPATTDSSNNRWKEGWLFEGTASISSESGVRSEIVGLFVHSFSPPWEKW
tara:strand:- start:153 stop:428 length:276 start_codon:yes stop_codon:yes gene_type:complete